MGFWFFMALLIRSWLCFDFLHYVVVKYFSILKECAAFIILTESM